MDGDVETEDDRKSFIHITGKKNVDGDTGSLQLSRVSHLTYYIHTILRLRLSRPKLKGLFINPAVKLNYH